MKADRRRNEGKLIVVRLMATGLSVLPLAFVITGIQSHSWLIRPQ